MIREARTVLVDVGNTSVKWRFSGTDHVRRIVGNERTIVEELGFAIQAAKFIAFSSVRGESFDEAFSSLLTGHEMRKVIRATVSASHGMLVNSYADFESLGVDRWLAMIAATNSSQGPIIVVDAGTALTIDIIDAFGRHTGGFILPGVLMSQNMLQVCTEKIRFEDSGTPSIAPGTSTKDCVNAGGWLGALASIEAICRSYAANKVFLTGGQGAQLLSLGLNAEYCEDLVLRGLELWVDEYLDEQQM